MPVIRAHAGPDPLATIRESLTSRLVNELLGVGDLGDPPTIFEVPSSDPGEVDVTVVWEAWRAMPGDQRPDVIAEAYRRFATILDESTAPARSGRAKEVVLPRASRSIGVTEEESRRFGTVPYGLKATPNGLDADQLILLRSAFRELGATRGGRSLEFLVPTRAMRDGALAQLRPLFPDVEFETFELNPAE